MRHMGWIPSTTIMALALAVPVPASAAALLQISTLLDSAGATVLSSANVTDNGAVVPLVGGNALTADANGSTGIIQTSGTIGGWNIIVSVGASGSPTATVDLAFVGTCGPFPGTGACDPFLRITFTDQGFTTPVGAGGFTFNFSDSDGNTASATGQAWDDPTNTQFGEVVPIGSKISLTGAGSNVVTGGGPAGPTPYSLTIQTQFGSASSGIYSSDANLSGVVPEPASLLLLGTGLVGLANLGRNRLARRRR